MNWTTTNRQRLINGTPTNRRFIARLAEERNFLLIIEAISKIIDNLLNRGSKASNRAPSDLPDPRVALKAHFRYDDFRTGQQAVVEKLLSGANLLGAFPTAFGKSICYQLPGLDVTGAYGDYFAVNLPDERSGGYFTRKGD